MPKHTPSINTQNTVELLASSRCSASDLVINTSDGCRQAQNSSQLCTIVAKVQAEILGTKHMALSAKPQQGVGVEAVPAVNWWWVSMALSLGKTCPTWQRLKMSSRVTWTLKCFKTCRACSFAFSEQFTEKHLPSPTWDCSLKRQVINQKDNKWDKFHASWSVFFFFFLIHLVCF